MKPIISVKRIQNAQAKRVKAGYKGLKLKYQTRNQLFVRPNLVWNPVTGLGTSYAWYTIAKVMQGPGDPVLVLNAFSYSTTTAKQASELAQLFTQLGLRYIRVYAPRGLQDLDAAATYCAKVWADCVVANHHARKPNKRLEADLKRRFDIVCALGGAPSRDLVEILAFAGHNRVTQLAFTRRKRLVKRIQANTVLELVPECL